MNQRQKLSESLLIQLNGMDHSRPFIKHPFTGCSDWKLSKAIACRIELVHFWPNCVWEAVDFRIFENKKKKKKPAWNGFQALSALPVFDFSLVCNFLPVWPAQRRLFFNSWILIIPLEFIETHVDSLRRIETHWDSLRLTETHWDSLRLIETHWDSLRLIETHWDSLRLIETQ